MTITSNARTRHAVAMAAPVDGESSRLSASSTVSAMALAVDAATGLTAAAVAAPHIPGLALVASGLSALNLARSYRERLSLRVLDRLPTILMALGTATLALLVGLELLSPTLLVGHVGELLRMSVLWTVLLVLGRMLVHRASAGLRRRGLLREGVIMVGAGERAVAVAGGLADATSIGLHPEGFIAPAGESKVERPAAHLGEPSDLARWIHELNVAHVIVDAASLTPDELRFVLQECDRLDVEVFLVPSDAEALRGIAVEHVGGVAMFRLPRRPFRTLQWAVKRAFDVVAASLGIVLLSPVMAVAGLLVTRETGAGLLFRQHRIGLDGRPFELLKLQTMVPETSTESSTRWNIAHDSRLGPVGRFLRRTSIDELPQLFNVLRGEMSLVGPRPERPHFVDRFQLEHPHYTARHRVPSGLTGLAQVEGLRGDTSIAQRVAYDNLYIEQWSLWLDIRILLRTVPTILRGEGG